MAIFSTLLFNTHESFFLINSDSFTAPATMGRSVVDAVAPCQVATYHVPPTHNLWPFHSLAPIHPFFHSPASKNIYISVSLFRVTRRFLLSPPIRSFFLIILAVCCPRSNHDAVPAAAHSMCMYVKPSFGLSTNFIGFFLSPFWLFGAASIKPPTHTHSLHPGQFNTRILGKRLTSSSLWRTGSVK